MNITEMILVIDNNKGTETNKILTIDAYKELIGAGDLSELADQMLLLGRTLGSQEGFAEYYHAADKTVFARFCRDEVQLGQFLQGAYNDSEEWRFDREACSPECTAKMDAIGMKEKGWIDTFILHYERVDRTFERGQIFRNFNDHDYMVLEALSPKNLVVMDTKSGALTIALGTNEYKRYPRGANPTGDNTTIGVSWEHGIYLGSKLSETNFKAYKREYGSAEPVEDIYDYRAAVKRKFFFLEDLTKDKDVPAQIRNEISQYLYAEYRTMDIDTFSDRLDEGKYDDGYEVMMKSQKERSCR